MSSLAVTWWGHSSATIELGSVRVGCDPVLVDRLMHLRRHTTTPSEVAAELDVVLVSHLHGDHLHVPSLVRVSPGAPIVVPRGALPRLGALRGRRIIEVGPGEHLQLAGLDIDVLPARHDGRRHPIGRQQAPALGFRVEGNGSSFWYPGDTGLDARIGEVDPVDLALVPIGGWGPTLGDQHLSPEGAAETVCRVGARWALPVHYGTFWPVGLRALHHASYRRLFSTPSARFLEAMSQAPTSATTLVLGHGERMVLHD